MKDSFACSCDIKKVDREIKMTSTRKCMRCLFNSSRSYRKKTDTMYFEYCSKRNMFENFFPHMFRFSECRHMTPMSVLYILKKNPYIHYQSCTKLKDPLKTGYTFCCQSSQSYIECYNYN